MESFVLWISQSIALCLLGCQRSESFLFFKAMGSAFGKQDLRSGLDQRSPFRARWFYRKGCISLACLCPSLPSPGRLPPEHLSHLFPMVIRHIYFAPSLSNYVALLPLFHLSALFLHIISRQARSQRLRPSPVATVTCATPYAHLSHQNRTP